jgi:hypothetical protein
MYGNLPAWVDEVLRGPHVQYGLLAASYGGRLLQVEYPSAGFDLGGQAGSTTTLQPGLYPGLVYPGPGLFPAPLTYTTSGALTLSTMLPGPSGFSMWLPLVDGSVTVDGGKPGARRALSVTLAPFDGLFDLLAPTGVELLPYVAIQAPTGDTAVIPQGVFPVDSQQVGWAANGTISITAADRWTRVAAARFLAPRAALTGVPLRDQIANLVLEPLPAGTSVTITATDQTSTPSQTWDQDRADAAQKLAAAGAIDVSFDRFGSPLVRDVPRLAARPVWTADAGDGGVVVSAQKTRGRSKTYNMVVVHSTNAATTTDPLLFDPVVVWDNDPSSPTFAGPGPGFAALKDAPPASLAGPFGQRPRYYSSPLLTDGGQALIAGRALLDRSLALETQYTLTTAPHPGLDDGDTIMVRLPGEAPRLQLVDAFTVSLNPAKASGQPLTTRSSRSDDVQDS